MAFSVNMLASTLAVLSFSSWASASPAHFPSPVSYKASPASLEKRNPTTTGWPLPHNITGDDEVGSTAATEGWGGIHVHDPSIVLGPDDHYWSFSTHGLIAISRASEANTLDGSWEVQGSVLDSGSSVISSDGSTDPWAPDVTEVNGTYYCFYSVSTSGSMDSSIGLAISTTLEPGSWTDLGAIITSSSDATSPLDTTNAIDPNLFIDPKTDTPYLNYGSFWSDIYQYNLASDLESVETSPAARQISFDPEGTYAEEGSFMSYSSAEKYYYLWYSHGQCCSYDADDLPTAGDEYSIRVGRSTSPEGPFVDSDGVDLTDGGGDIVYGSHSYVYGPGGQGVLKDYNDREVLYYHYINIDLNPTYSDAEKLLGWSYIKYRSGWPYLSYTV